MVPAVVLDKLLEVHQGEKVVHCINWGGYLTWHGWKKEPRLLTWIDDRNEIYPPSRLDAYQNLMDARAGWEEALRREQIGLVCIEVETALAARLREAPGWKEICRDKHAVLFRREGSRKNTLPVVAKAKGREASSEENNR